MVDLRPHRYFDPRFIQFGLTALILKIAVYLIQSHTNPIMHPTNTVVIRKGNSSATVHVFGATVTSWVAEGEEMLFVSKNSLFDGIKAIRGGIPVIFPQFGPWKNGPQHGFARISRWNLKDDSQIGSESVTLVLEDSDSTRKLWDHRFRFEYTISIVNEKQMKMNAHITNMGEIPFPFTFLLHTYFFVPDITLCEISGLTGCTYIDKVKNGESFKEDREEVTISEFTDRVYIDTPSVLELKNVASKKVATVEKVNLPDTVVWNPWSENAKSMSDFGDDEWRNMICVEAGAVSTPIVLDSKKSFFASQILSVV